MEIYFDRMGYNIYGTGNQYPEVGYWVFRWDAKTLNPGYLDRIYSFLNKKWFIEEIAHTSLCVLKYNCNN